MQRTMIQKIAIALALVFFSNAVIAQDLNLEQYAKAEGNLFWVWVVVVAVVTLVLFASLFFSKKKEYTQ